jgi:hypothetical protein
MVVGPAKAVKPEHSPELIHSEEPLNFLMPEPFDTSRFMA